MARRRRAEKRQVLADPKFGEVLITKFMNVLMLDGKKSAAEKIVYGALEKIAGKSKVGSLDVFKQAIDKVRPHLEVRSRRVGGATYQVPVEVRPERRNALAIRWIINFAKSRSGQTMSEKLAAELLDAFNSRGASVKKKDDTHKMAEANKAFAHYRW